MRGWRGAARCLSRMGRGQLTRYQPGSEGVENVDEAIDAEEDSAALSPAVDYESGDLASTEFALEAHPVEEFIVTNSELINSGRRLAIWGWSGRPEWAPALDAGRAARLPCHRPRQPTLLSLSS